jgi:hypothetical protein
MFSVKKEKDLSMYKLAIVVLIGISLGCNSSGEETEDMDNSGGSGGSPTQAATTPDTAPSSNTNAPPNSELVGSWKGTWHQGDSINTGAIDLTITSGGSLSGQMAFASETNRDLFGPGTIAGVVHGNATTFTYRFKHIPLDLPCTGTFGVVTNQQVTVSYTISGSKSTAPHFELTKQ